MVKNKVIGLSVALTLATLMVGCANVTTGQLHAPLEVMPTEVCIIRNPQVTIDAAISSLQSAFQRRGIKSTVVDDVGACRSEYRLSYVMRRSWDATTYLGLAELTLYRNNAIVSTAKYKAGSMTLTKWGKTAERIDKTVGKLLGEPD